jgi:hypothetical protein
MFQRKQDNGRMMLKITDCLSLFGRGSTFGYRWPCVEIQCYQLSGSQSVNQFFTNHELSSCSLIQ